MTQFVLAHRHAPASHAAGTMSAAFRGVMAQFAAWRVRQRQRVLLASLSDVELHDIGISRAQASFEAEKPFWRG